MTTSRKRNRYYHFECIVCLRTPDGENVWHSEHARSWRRHLELSSILRAGLLESRWWMLTKGERLAIVARAEANDGKSMQRVRDLIEVDGNIRNAAHRYAITGYQSFVDRFYADPTYGTTPDGLGDEP